MDVNTSDDVFDWDSEDEREIANIPVSSSTVVVPAFDPGEASSSGSKQFDTFMRMGFPERLVARVLQESGDKDESYIVERLLEYSMELEASREGQQALETSPEEPQNEPDSLSSEYEDNCLSDMDSFSDFEDVAIPDCGGNSKKMGLVAMGYTINEASNAVARCDAGGNNSTYDELIDFILAARTVKEEDENYPIEVNPRPLKRRFEQEMKKHKKQRVDRCRAPTEDDELIRPPNPMIGFGVPTDSFDPIPRTLPEPAVGPPYFYYENVALAPKGVWSSISRFLYDVEPEFVDSKYFCAAARKRGYVHNLPIANRYPLLPLPPRTITEALPMTRRWWPAWDTRTKLNCIQTCVASAKLTERIRKSLEPHDDEPPLSVQRYVLEECRKWNLVWVGRNKLAPLEPDEVEMLLGFPKNHTRGGGISRTDRYKSLGNSFQVDTVAYHLSVLKEMFPNGINILSLFSGIGGAEVALHRLGVRIKNVVSVEKSDVNRNIVRSWWEQTNQKGTLIDCTDVQTVDDRMLEQFVSRFGAFDLVVGGSPCNNLAGSNRYHRDGLEGTESSLFYDYFRILELVKNIQRPR